MPCISFPCVSDFLDLFHLPFSPVSNASSNLSCMVNMSSMLLSCAPHACLDLIFWTLLVFCLLHQPQ